MLLKAAGLMPYSQNTPQSSFKASLSEKPLKTSLYESPGVLQVIPLSAQNRQKTFSGFHLIYFRYRLKYIYPAFKYMLRITN